MLEAVDLSDKKHTQAGALSGGMKRKLQVRHCDEQVVPGRPADGCQQCPRRHAACSHEGAMQRKLQAGQWQELGHHERNRSSCTLL